MRVRRGLGLLVVLAMSLGAAPAGAAAGGDSAWPQFRGPQRDGTSGEHGLIRNWPESGPPVLWRRSVGEGFSEVTVDGGRVFVLAAEGESEIATCLDGGSGEEIWKTTIGPRFEEVFGDGPRATPVIEDGTMYVLSSLGRLHRLATADGSIRWSLDLVEQFGSRVPRRGFSASPLIEGDLLLLEAGGAEGKAFLAIDKKSGDVRWSAGEGGAGYSSGIATTIDGVRQVVFARTAGKAIVSYRPSGEVLWTHPWEGGPIGMPVLVPPNRIFVSSALDIGAILLELRTTDGGVEAREVWTSRFMKNHFSSSVLAGDHIYGFDNATLRCISAETGERRWAHRGFGKGSLILADGMLIVLSDTGELALVEATPEEYREMASFQAMTGRAWTAPALARGRLYLRDQDEMACVDLRAGGGKASAP